LLLNTRLSIVIYSLIGCAVCDSEHGDKNMKKSILAISAAVAFVATPLLAEDTVAITTTKSSQAAGASLGLGGLGAGVAIGAIALIGIVVAVSNSGSGT
jgi:hypothetical protein